jgi:hypothetical protein
MDLKLDSDHDLAIENDTLVLVDGIDAIRQELDIALQFFLNEWFLDTRLGLPYYEKILGKKPRINVIKGVFRDAILQVNGVNSIFDLNIDFSAATRILSVEFRAGTVEGELTYNKEFIVP